MAKKYLVMGISFSTAWLGGIVLFSGLLSECQKINVVFKIDCIGSNRQLLPNLLKRKKCAKIVPKG